MSSTLRRFEILLPLRFNDGLPVPDELVGQTIQELRQQFRAASPQKRKRSTATGGKHQTEVFRDELVRVFVDVADSGENRAFFVAYKEQLKARFDS